jgi:hypothetical protein
MRLLAFAGIAFIFVVLIAVTSYLVGGTFFRGEAPSSGSTSKQETLNASGQDAQEIANLKRQAMRRATNAGDQGADQREYYRSALRMLRRMTDIHSRL